MPASENASTERVVEIVETCNGDVLRTFYCIRDPEFDHWLSREPFDGDIWTKTPQSRLECTSHEEAEATLAEFQTWREDNETSEIPL